MDINQLKLSLISLAVGLFCLYYAFKRTKQKRQVEDTIRSFTATAPQGLVELQGFAWPVDEKIIKLPSNLEGVYYSFSLEQLVTKGSGKNKRKEWVSVYRYYFGNSFYLLDGKGLAVVNIQSSELILDSNKICNWNNLSNEKKLHLMTDIITRPVASFPPSNFLFGIFSESFRIVENEIPVGSPLYVRGSFSSSGHQNTFAESVGLTRFHQQVFKENSGQLKNVNALLDENKNTNVSAQEAQVGYSKIAQISKRRTIQEKLPEKPIEVFGELKKTTEHQLLVSNAHEQHLVDRLGKFLIPLYAGAVCFIAVSIFTFSMSTEKFTQLLSPQSKAKPASQRKVAVEKPVDKQRKSR